MNDDDVPAGVPRRNPGDLSWPGMIIGMVITLATVGAIFYYTRDVSLIPLGASGTVEGAGFSLEAEACDTGERKNIETVQGRNNPIGGVRILGRQGGSVFIDAKGERVVIGPPGCASADCKIELTRARCSQFHVTIGWTGNKVNNRDVYAGRAELKCELGDGVLKATLDFPGCA